MTRYAIMEKVRIVEEVRYDTIQVCDSLEEAQALTADTPWREIVPYLSEEYERKRHYHAYFTAPPPPRTVEQVLEERIAIEEHCARLGITLARKTTDTVQ